MSSSNLLRLGGLAAVIGGGLFVVSDLLILVDDPNDPIGTVTSASYALSVWLALISSVLLAGGLVGIYAARSEATGVLGLIGFALAFAGQILAAGGTWSEAFVTPALAQEAPELLLSDPPGIVMFGNILTSGLLTVGWFGSMSTGYNTVGVRCLPSKPRNMLTRATLLWLHGTTPARLDILASFAQVKC
jgi:uncharacterized membrane protein (UPF0136 family)